MKLILAILLSIFFIGCQYVVMRKSTLDFVEEGNQHIGYMKCLADKQKELFESQK